MSIEDLSRALEDSRSRGKSIALGAAAEGRDLTATEEGQIRAILRQAAAIRDEFSVRPQAPAERTYAAGTVPRPAYDRVARVGREERVYRPDAPGGKTGRAFLSDVIGMFFRQDPQAIVRLGRHMDEERVERGQYLTRATGTGSFTGLTVPQYLTEMYAPAVAALRPFANIATHHDLPPDGMTVNISRITTPSSVGLQSSQNTAVASQDMSDTLLTENVQTIAGQQTISRQAIDRGTGIEDVTLQDLYKRYATALDSTMINQATTGLSALAQTFTYTSASPTVTEIWPHMFGLQNNLEAALLAQAMPTHFVMHPRRWNWFCAQLGTSWPLVAAQTTPTQSGGITLTNAYGESVRGVWANGMRITVDANVPTNLGAGTNQDEIYVVSDAEVHLWEDPAAPVFIRAEQPAAASLGVLLVVYGYSAFTMRRYTNGVGKMSGTGLVAPSF